MRKVKGHSTSEDVAHVRATAYDKAGNDTVDKLADEGVKAIQGSGFAKLADWCTRRHGQYRNFMIRIQRYIAAVMIAEKHEREKGNKVDKAILGYDPQKWVKSDAEIKNDQSIITFERKSCLHQPKANIVSNCVKKALRRGAQLPH